MAQFKRPMKSKLTNAQKLDAAWAAFAAHNSAETQPAGSITATQYRERFGGTHRQAASALDKLPSKLMRLSVGGQIRSVRVYFLKEAA